MQTKNRGIASKWPGILQLLQDLSFCARGNHVFFAKKIERSKITFTTNGKSEFCTPWPSFPFLAVDFSLLLHRQKLVASRQFYLQTLVEEFDKESTDWCKTIFFFNILMQHKSRKPGTVSCIPCTVLYDIFADLFLFRWVRVEFDLGVLSGSIAFRSVHEIQSVTFH